jgi:hypothetical protein
MLGDIGVLLVRIELDFHSVYIQFAVLRLKAKLALDTHRRYTTAFFRRPGGHTLVWSYARCPWLPPFT